MLTYGALFAGYGGLEMGVQSVLGGRALWHAEFEKAPSAILAHRYPGVPNLGDVTKVDWASVPKVDVITGGSPCQDLSHAGKRKGMTDGTRSNLWAEMREAIAVIRPRLVVWENVRGALSAPADSDLEPCPGCVGDLDDGPVLRALGRVLGDLAELGFDARWYGLRAADVGAAHGRFRVFLLATPADANDAGWGEHGRPEPVRAEQPAAERLGDDTAAGLTLLPTPACNDMGASYTPETWDAWTDRMKAEHGNGNGHGKSLSIEALRLLPTPSVADGMGGHLSRSGDRSNELLLPGVAKDLAGRLLPTPTSADSKASGGSTPSDVTLTDAVVRTDLGAVENPRHRLLPTPRADEGGGNGEAEALRHSPGLSNIRTHFPDQDWREYEAAIRRHEAALGRPAPEPTEPGAKGQPRLSPRFVEWLMMLPDGWVTDVPGISRNGQLKALGNGVVPAQCAAALRAFIHDTRQEAAA